MLFQLFKLWPTCNWCDRERSRGKQLWASDTLNYQGGTLSFWSPDPSCSWGYSMSKQPWEPWEPWELPGHPWHPALPLAETWLPGKYHWNVPPYLVCDLGYISIQRRIHKLYEFAVEDCQHSKSKPSTSLSIYFRTCLNFGRASMLLQKEWTTDSTLCFWF